MNSIRKRLTYANVMSSIAVFLVIGGATAFAVSHLGKNSVGTKQLKSNAVTTAKIKKNAVTAKKIKAGAVNGDKVQNGSLLSGDFAAGQLPKGATGPTGPTGVVGTVVVRRTDVPLPAGPAAEKPGALTSAFATCAAGEKIIGGSVNVSDPPNAEVRISRPATDNIEAGGIPNDGDAFTFWKGTARTTTNVVATARVFAICAQTP